MPELQDQGKTFGIAVRARSEDTPISIELCTLDHGPPVDRLVGLRMGMFDEDEEQRREERDREHERLTRPRKFDAALTVGLGLDRKTTELSRSDLDALQALVNRVVEEIHAKDLEVERYENKQKEEKTQ